MNHQLPRVFSLACLSTNLLSDASDKKQSDRRCFSPLANFTGCNRRMESARRAVCQSQETLEFFCLFQMLVRKFRCYSCESPQDGHRLDWRNSQLVYETSELGGNLPLL